MFSAIHKTEKFIEKISQYLLHCRSVLYLTEPLKAVMIQWESLAGEPYLFRTFFSRKSYSSEAMGKPNKSTLDIIYYWGQS
jgi:hypothetical protein